MQHSAPAFGTAFGCACARRRWEARQALNREALEGQMEKVDGGEYRFADRPERLPHSYTLQAVKRSITDTA